MDCQLPETGGAFVLTALAAAVLVVLGVVVLVSVRRRGAATMLVALVFSGAAVGRWRAPRRCCGWM